jgi:hypothetical protein
MPDYENTRIKDISESQLADAIEQTTNVSQREALKLARMYCKFNHQDGEETLGEVLKNLEVDADIEVLENSRRSKAEN